MPITLPYIPEYITVHLGSPDSSAANVTVSFVEYIKNVVSSEIYPTWETSAISANTLAIVSFAVNRVYTEYYKSRGYNFDITSSTAIDQKFIHGRNYFENISEIVEQLFNDYLRRIGNIEPLAAKFCNGTTVTCNGLSQWGSQDLAKDGLSSFEILKFYYGNDIEIVNNATIRGITESYPGSPLSIGDNNSNVKFVQTELNRISQNYPAIPKITADGNFGTQTQNAVKIFQSIFSLTADGIVGRATWYRLVQLYVAVLGLSELQSQGVIYSGISWEYPDAIIKGDSGIKVTHLQYMLSVISNFIEEVPPLLINGYFGEETYSAVIAFERFANIPVNGIVNAETWDSIYSQFEGIENTVFQDGELFPFKAEQTTAENIVDLQKQLNKLSAYSNEKQISENGQMDYNTYKAVSDFQQDNNILPNGIPDKDTLNALAEEINKNRYQNSSRFIQFPKKSLSIGDKDSEIIL